MALEPLAGPFPVQLSGVAGYFPNRPHWIDGVGLCGWLTSGGAAKGFVICQMDGTAHVRNNNPSIGYRGYVMADAVTGGACWYDDYLGWTFYARLDPKTGRQAEILISGGGGRWTRLSDRFISAYADKVLWAPLSATSESQEAVEYSFGNAGSTYGRISLAREQGLVWVGFDNGDLYRYDTVAKTKVGEKTGIGLANKGLWYAREWDIFLSLHAKTASEDEIRLWANQVRPAALSNPAALTTPTRGRVATFRARLSGSYGESCPGFLVNWTLSGVGSLSAVQSETDTQGYAAVDYIAPVGSTGTATIACEVTY